MKLILIRSIRYLLMAIFGAFILIPGYEVWVGDLPWLESKAQILANLTFASTEMWKRVFTFYLALWCGKAILWALNTASGKPT
ncbi:MAG: hypothetical protein CBC79_02580 [Gammaproteobacteria bacterium TMED119]|nr:MAG: hypothetical protein CBC79_02580 [Gammaproteobacteria bacterium TMED119]RCL46546.1 MAG: hypothetical protein DBW91_02060 [Candidatus Thioglobus sp.]|tara:strand:- start:206 stop:454 length:249 start_codon:yes stop_codon:yes gene_type:complete